MRHADVVIENIDLLDVVTIVSAVDLVRVNVEVEPLRILRRFHVDVPHGCCEAEPDEDREQSEHDSRPWEDGLVQESIECIHCV
jgi:hypothetical protein